MFLEIHRTENDYENALTLKMFLFQFVNFYASIFYIAFIKPWLTNPPGAESYKIGKYKAEEVRESKRILLERRKTTNLRSFASV